MVTKYCAIVLISLFTHHTIHALYTSLEVYKSSSTSLTPTESPDFTTDVTIITVPQDVLNNTDVKRLLDLMHSYTRKVKMVSMTPMPQSATDRRNRLKNHKFSVNPYINDDRCNENSAMDILNSAYAKVTAHLWMIQKDTQNNLDVMMKLNMLKGMLMEEGMRAKDKKLICREQ